MTPDMTPFNDTNTTSNHTEPCVEFDPSVIKEPEASATFRIVGMSLIIFVSLVGNFLVCRGAIAKPNRPFVYYLVINLSLAEIVYTIAQPFMIVYESKPYSWIFGSFLCTIIKPLEFTGNMTATFTLAAIAVYRCIMISKPYRHRPTKRVACLVLTCSWVWGIIWAMPYAMTYKCIDEEHDCGQIVKICQREKSMPVFETVYYVAFFLFPFALMLVSYGIVIRKIKEHIQIERRGSNEMESADWISRAGSTTRETDIRAEQGQPAVNEPQLSPEEETRQQEIPDRTRQGSCMQSKQGQRSKMAKLENDVLNMIYIIMVIFFVCYLPWAMMFLLSHVAKLESALHWDYHWIFFWYMMLLHSLPSALHPICYGATSKVLGMKLRWPWNKKLKIQQWSMKNCLDGTDNTDS